MSGFTGWGCAEFQKRYQGILTSRNPGDANPVRISEAEGPLYSHLMVQSSSARSCSQPPCKMARFRTSAPIRIFPHNLRVVKRIRTKQELCGLFSPSSHEGGGRNNRSSIFCVILGQRLAAQLGKNVLCQTHPIQFNLLIDLVPPKDRTPQIFRRGFRLYGVEITLITSFVQNSPSELRSSDPC
jgi:hypothetical protein